MKNAIRLFGYVLICSLLLVAATDLSAKSKKQPKDQLKLSEIETLFFISQDLEPYTAVHIDGKTNCYCSCRDSLWSCTDVSCKVHMKECENPEPTEQAGDQSRVTPPTYSQYAVENDEPSTVLPSQLAQPEKAHSQTRTAAQSTMSVPQVTEQPLAATVKTPAPAPTAATNAYSGVKVNDVQPANPGNRYVPESMNW